MTSSSRESRQRKVIKRPATIAPASPTLVEQPLATAVLLADDTGPDVRHSLEQVRRAGFEEGKRAGFQEAMVSLAARKAESAERLRAEVAVAAEMAASAHASILEEAVGDMARLTPKIVEALVGEIEWPHTPVHAALERALALVPEGPHLVIRLHPECALDAEEVAELTSRFDGVQVVRDTSVETDGCVVVAGSCTVDAQISRALERVRDQFRDLKLFSKEAS